MTRYPTLSQYPDTESQVFALIPVIGLTQPGIELLPFCKTSLRPTDLFSSVAQRWRVMSGQLTSCVGQCWWVLSDLLTPCVMQC